MRGQTAESNAATFLLLLLLPDFIFIGLHFSPWAQSSAAPLLSLEEDLSYPEVYQYIKELWIVLLLVLLRCRLRARLRSWLRLVPPGSPRL